MRDPFDPESTYRSRETIGEGVTVHVFEVDGQRYAHLSPEIAEQRRPGHASSVTSSSFGAFTEASPEGLGYYAPQYYYARELLK